MRVRSVAALYLVFAILFLMAVVSEVFVDDSVKPTSLFGYLVISTVVSGVITSTITEKLDVRILS